MDIVIVGGGDVGTYIATILSKQQHNITLIDKDKKYLEGISSQIDIGVRVGSGTDWKLLDDLRELAPQLFITLTGSDETNLAACTIAKHLGYPRTIARVRDNRYMNRARLDFARLFNVDYFISPELLVAHDILKIMLSPSSLAVETFAHGAVQLRTLAVPQKWKHAHTALKDLRVPNSVMIGLIRRQSTLIFPHGDDQLLPGDEVTFIGESEPIEQIHNFLGIKEKNIQSVTIVGGSLTGFNLAKLLETRDIPIRLIEKDYERCVELAEKLSKCTIINHNAADIDFLLEEKIGGTDVLVTCTQSDEINLVIAQLAKETGCQNAIVMLSNISYTPLVEKLGFHHVVSPRISAANHILSQLFSGKVSSLVSLYDNQAEIIEITVSQDSKAAGVPISDLGPYLPNDLLIAMIQNRGRTLIAHGARVISPGDTVILITNPKHMHELEKIF